MTLHLAYPFALLAILSLQPACNDPARVDDGVADDAPPGKADGVGDADLTDACATQHAGETDGVPIVVCDELHAAPPFVHLPADERNGDAVTLHAALMRNGNYEILDRTGAAYVIVTATGKAATGDEIADARMPSYRFWYLTYRVRGTLTTWVNPSGGASYPAIVIDELAPEVLVDGKLLDARMLGTWEGTMPPRNGDLTWDYTATVPVRVTFEQLTPRANIPVFEDNGALLPDGTAWNIVGRVDNLDAAVRSADGSCLPSLASRGATNPLYGALENLITLWRLGNMHGPLDSQLVIEFPDGTNLGVGMGDIAPVHPTGAILDRAHTTWSAGSHNSWQFSVALTRVSTGGETCTP